MQGIEIKIVKEWAADEIIRLFESGGWWNESNDCSLINDIISGSFAFFVAVDTSTGKAVGMARVLSDGTSDAYIQDMVVLDEYRGRGIGKLLVEKIIGFCDLRGIEWLGLIAEPGYYSFYEQVGFSKMKQYVPMLFLKEKK